MTAISPASIRVGLIGYGYVGKTFHAPLLRAVPGFEITVVGSSAPERVHADLPEVEVVGEPEAAATHAAVDLVVIASPNESHAPLATAALKAGKAVVVDKPFTVRLEEARALSALAEELGGFLSVFHNRRWDSEFLAAKALLQTGRLGEVVHYEAHIDRFRPEVKARWREQVGPGAGLWFDLGPHLIDHALQLFGLPRSVSAQLAVLRPSGQVDDWAHVILEYERMRVVLHGSMLVAGGVPRMAMHGTLGSWIKPGADIQEDQLKAGMKPGAAGWGEDPDPGIFFEGGTGVRMEIPAPAGDHREYYAGVLEALRGRAPNPVPSAQATTVMAVLETAMKSSTDGRRLPVEFSDRERSAWA